jgi:hypothetical protein
VSLPLLFAQPVEAARQPLEQVAPPLSYFQDDSDTAKDAQIVSFGVQRDRCAVVRLQQNEPTCGEARWVKVGPINHLSEATRIALVLLHLINGPHCARWAFGVGLCVRLGGGWMLLP